MGLSMTGPHVGILFEGVKLRALDNVRKAFAKAGDATAKDIREAVQKDLSTSGNFGKWGSGVRAEAQEDIGKIVIDVRMQDPTPAWWIVHQEGRVIHGKPWLAIPIGDTPKNLYARYNPEPLVWVNRSPHPLLLSLKDHRPKYFAIQSVTIPKRLHVDEAAIEGSKSFAGHFGENIK
jgi:hypothetical protein